MMPSRATQWMRQVGKELSALPKERREAILDDLQEHISTGLENGTGVEEILSQLGTPEGVADQWLDEQGKLPYFTPRRIAQVIALALAVSATMLLLFLPLGIEVTEVATGPDEPSVTTGTRGVTLLEAQGPVVLIPLLFPVLAAALPFASRGPAPRSLAIISAVFLGGFTALGLFSIGVFYLPALTAALAGVFLRAHQKRHNADKAVAIDP